MQADMSAMTLAIDANADAGVPDTSFGMRELTDSELQSVSGGLAPVFIVAALAAVFVAGVAAGAIKAHREHCGC